MNDKQAVVLTGEKRIVLFHMRSQLSALGLEIKGLGHSSGQSISAHIKRIYDIKKRKKVDVYKEFHALILEKEEEEGIIPRLLNRSEKEILGME